MEPPTPPPPSSSTPPPPHSRQTGGFSLLENMLEDPRGSFFDRTVAVTTTSSEMPTDRPSGSFGVVGDGGPGDGAVPLGFEYSGGAFHPGSGGGAEGFSSHFSRDEEYKKKREKNNEAVRKSRQKTKNRTLETARRVEALKQENDELEQRSKSLTKELKLLKEIFVKQMNQQGGQEEEEG